MRFISFQFSAESSCWLTHVQLCIICIATDVKLIKHSSVSPDESWPSEPSGWNSRSSSTHLCHTDKWANHIHTNISRCLFCPAERSHAPDPVRDPALLPVDSVEDHFLLDAGSYDEVGVVCCEAALSEERAQTHVLLCCVAGLVGGAAVAGPCHALATTPLHPPPAVVPGVPAALLRPLWHLLLPLLQRHLLLPPRWPRLPPPAHLTTCRLTQHMWCYNKWVNQYIFKSHTEAFLCRWFKLQTPAGWRWIFIVFIVSPTRESTDTKTHTIHNMKYTVHNTIHLKRNCKCSRSVTVLN